MNLRGLSVKIAVSLAIAAGSAAHANVFSGSFTRTENWVTSPGGDPCNWNWGASWNVNTTTNIMTISQTVRLNAAAGSAAITNAEISNWETRIESSWNNQNVYTICFNPLTGDLKDFILRYDITLSTTATTSDSTVTVHDGDGGTNAADWYRTGGSGVNVASLNVASHEVGHLLGNPDEYTDGGCIISGASWNAPSFTTNSLMNNTSASLPNTLVGRTLSRHYGAWDIAFALFDIGKGQGNIYTTVPTPGTFGFVAGLGVFAARRRREK